MASKRRKGSQLLTARVVEILTVGRTRLYSRSTAAKAAVMDRARQAVEDIVANPPESKVGSCTAAGSAAAISQWVCAGLPRGNYFYSPSTPKQYGTARLASQLKLSLN